MKEITLFLNLLLSGAPKALIAKSMRENNFVVVTYGHEEVASNGFVQGLSKTGILYEEVPSITRDITTVPGDFNYSAEITAAVVDVLLWSYHNDTISYWAGDQWETLQA